jgi:hypothetical protein
MLRCFDSLQVSPNDHLRKFAAGALFNAAESIHRETQMKSLDTLDRDEYSADALPRRRGGASVLSTVFAEKEPEIELSDDVLAELAKREAALQAEQAEREEAAQLLQAAVRRKRTNKAFRVLRYYAGAVRIISRLIRRRRRRKRLRAALLLQARIRAYLCSSRGICSFGTVLLIIRCTRTAHLRAMTRLVNRRHFLRTTQDAMAQLEEKRREAEKLVDKFELRKTHQEAYEVRRGEAHGSHDAAEPTPGRFRRGASILGSRGQRFAMGLLPVHSLPKASAISSRIPMMLPGKSPGTKRASVADATASESRPVLPLRLAAGTGSWTSPLSSQAGPPAARNEGPPTPHQALGSDDFTATRTPTRLGSSAEDVEWRRSAAAAARAVLTLSELDDVDGAAPSRRLFPPSKGNVAKRHGVGALEGPHSKPTAPPFAAGYGRESTGHRGLSFGNRLTTSDRVPAMAYSASSVSLPGMCGHGSSGKRPLAASSGPRYLASDTTGLYGSSSASALPLAAIGGGGVRAPASLAGPP